MIKKGLFGGTFDPIHIGHLNIAYEALYRLNLESVVFMPSGNPPHKTDKTIRDSKLRMDMVKLAIEDEELFSVSQYEITKEEFSYTFETLEYFNKTEKNTRWYFITGADCLMQLETWKNVEKIMNSCEFVVFNRDGYNIKDILNKKRFIEEKYNKRIFFLDIPILEISSSSIRRKIYKNEEISYLVGKNVKKYICERNLYPRG